MGLERQGLGCMNSELHLCSFKTQPNKALIRGAGKKKTAALSEHFTASSDFMVLFHRLMEKPMPHCKNPLHPLCLREVPGGEGCRVSKSIPNFGEEWAFLAVNQLQ